MKLSRCINKNKLYKNVLLIYFCRKKIKNLYNFFHIIKSLKCYNKNENAITCLNHRQIGNITALANRTLVRGKKKLMGVVQIKKTFFMQVY